MRTEGAKKVSSFTVIETSGVPIKMWNCGVQFEDKAVEQLKNVAGMPFVSPYVAAMPDTHWGMGCTVGSVIPTVDAIIPAAVGVDIGCGMMAVRITDAELRHPLSEIRAELERAIPHGRTDNGGPADRGSWHDIRDAYARVWEYEFQDEYDDLLFKHPGARSRNAERQLGTLGTGNHFLEVCKDETDAIWIVLHSGSRGLGNRIGTYFTQRAKELCARYFVTLADPDLAFIPKGDPLYGDYISALHLAQKFAWTNRELMMIAAVHVLGGVEVERIHCHHNYMAEERHFGRDVILTRKGAVDASLDKLVIIPGSMGASTYIARGLGCRDSFHSCSHGAGRAMGRKQAEREITVEQHKAALAGIECHSGAETIDESPAAYKPIDAVMAAQTDLVEPVHILHQIVNVKGWEK
jgi:tRNA-splicing ligase RtcB (3'-phosphate/5'-hydroxy nucleic acid ligase)